MRFGADQQNRFCHARTDVGIGQLHSVEESGALLPDIKAGDILRFPVWTEGVRRIRER